MNKKENIVFIRSVPPNTSVTLKERVKGEGTVEELIVRFYPGQQRALRVNAAINHGNDTFEPIVNYSNGLLANDTPSEQYLSGDDDRLQFDTSLPCRNDDEIWITATNTDTENTYDLVAYVMIDYLGGQHRAGGN